jgi:uncharacterized protein
MDFDWDDTKARANFRKHAVSFREAVSVFADPLARILDDPDHSDEELREIVVGHSDRNRLLIVSFAERGESVRIISARRGTSRERTNYEEKPKRG